MVSLTLVLIRMKYKRPRNISNNTWHSFISYLLECIIVYIKRFKTQTLSNLTKQYIKNSNHFHILLQYSGKERWFNQIVLLFYWVHVVNAFLIHSCIIPSVHIYRFNVFVYPFNVKLRETRYDKNEIALFQTIIFK